MKEIVASVQMGDGTLSWNWEFDFSGVKLTRQVAYGGGSQAEYNISEWTDGGGAGIGYIDPNDTSLGESEYGGGVTLQRKLIPAYGEGQFLKLGVTASVNGFNVVVQHMSVAPKIGRMVT
jgi:hypothetical protein